jgi:PAS domain-containing protein
MKTDKNSLKQFNQPSNRMGDISSQNSTLTRDIQYKHIRKLNLEQDQNLNEIEIRKKEFHKTILEHENLGNWYSDLYDYAPVSYFTIDQNGLILDVNYAGARLLDLERCYLIKKEVSSFIAPGFHDVFLSHCKHVFNTKSKQTCELKLVKMVVFYFGLCWKA